MRHISTPGNWDATLFVIPLGQSGDPKSPHFKDQFDASTGKTAAVLPFTPAAVYAAAREVWKVSGKK
jgi:penicillin amidase